MSKLREFLTGASLFFYGFSTCAVMSAPMIEGSNVQLADALYYISWFILMVMIVGEEQ